MRIEPCRACGQPIDVDRQCRHVTGTPLDNGEYIIASAWADPNHEDRKRGLIFRATDGSR